MENIDSQTARKIEELKELETAMQHLLMQKQEIQVELNEIENAKSEIKKSGDEVYKIVSGIMIKTSKNTIEKELEEKIVLSKTKISAVEKQEEVLEKKSLKLREEIDKKISSEKN